MRRLTHLVYPFVLALTGACGSGTKAYIPVDSPLRAWQPPEPDAYTPEPAPAPTPAPAAAPNAEEKKTEATPPAATTAATPAKAETAKKAAPAKTAAKPKPAAAPKKEKVQAEKTP
jgi:hypothetical protein